jgi:hypothetical protein
MTSISRIQLSLKNSMEDQLLPEPGFLVTCSPALRPVLLGLK